MPIAPQDFPTKIPRLFLCSALAGAILFLTSVTASAQDTAPPAIVASSGRPLQFDVASVKEVVPEAGIIHTTGLRVYPGGRVGIQSFSLKTLIEAASGFSYWQISGGEDWMDKVKFDVEAKAQDDAQSPFNLGHTWYTLDDPRLRQMLQTLLTDRFQLRGHIQTKPGPVYFIEKSDKPIRLAPTKPTDKVAPGSMGFCSIGRAAATWVISNCTVQQIAHFDSSFVSHHPVYDNTGLQDHFDFRYQIVQVDPSVMPSDDSSFPDAVEAMGLKFRQATGAVEYFFIDHAEKPSPN